MNKFLKYIADKIHDDRSRKTFLVYTFGTVGALFALIFSVKGIKEGRELVYLITIFSMFISAVANLFYLYFRVQYKKTLRV